MTKQTVAVIDYGMGNLHSVASALNHVAPEANIIVTANPAEVAAADRVIFPGVGAIRDCMAEINRLGFGQLLREQIASGKPVLGICVGMQALMQHSEENNGVECIGILSGQVKFFGEHLTDSAGKLLKVPHMGWNQVTHNSHPLWANIPQQSRFYFVHSFYVRAEDRNLVAGYCEYGVQFDAALAKDNLFAVQFHPEKSHTAGLQLLKNFVHWDGKF
jgi:glutamine amidotransferase